MPPKPARNTETTVLPPAELGHNSQVSDEALIAENFALEDQVKAGLAKFNAWAAPHKARIAEIESEIRRRLLERKADSTKTDAGTAYFSDIMNTKIEDLEALFDYVADNWGTVDAKVNIPVAAVREHMQTNDGRPPPGISFFASNL